MNNGTKLVDSINLITNLNNVISLIHFTWIPEAGVRTHSQKEKYSKTGLKEKDSAPRYKISAFWRRKEKKKKKDV